VRLTQSFERPARRQGDQVRYTPCAQQSQHRDTGKAFVGRQAPETQSTAARRCQEAGHNLHHRFAVGDHSQSQRQALALMDDLQGGIAVKMRRPAFGLGTTDFRCVGFRLPVIGQVVEVERDLHAALPQTTAQLWWHLRLEGLIKSLLKLSQSRLVSRQSRAQLFPDGIGGRCLR
jgi:hypothetical protein